MRYVYLCLVIILIYGCALGDKQRYVEDLQDAIIIKHYPNPCDIHTSSQTKNPPYPYMWYYRTTVKNNLTIPVRITDIGFYVYENGKWMQRNVLEKNPSGPDSGESQSGAFTSIIQLFSNTEFSQWNDSGDPIIDGWLQPGEVALNGQTWHGTKSNKFKFLRAKWVYWAEDKKGRNYYAEEEIHSVPIEE